MSELLTSALAEATAAAMREHAEPTGWLRGTRHVVTAAQFDTAARIIREAEPSVANGVSSERPAFIHADEQDDPESLRLKVGIFSGDEFWIDRSGVVVEIDRGGARWTIEVLRGLLAAEEPV